MATLSLKEKKEKELEEYLDSDFIGKIMFSLPELSVSLFFVNGKKINLKFDENYRFDELCLMNGDVGQILQEGIYFRENQNDKAVLNFIYNVLDRSAESFIFYCERLVMELDKNK